MDEKIAKIQKICETTLKDIKKHKKGEDNNHWRYNTIYNFRDRLQRNKIITVDGWNW